MTTRDELLQLERAGWEALSTSGEAAIRFYADHLARDVLMVLPGGMVIDDRDRVIESMGGAPWTSYELSDERVLELGGEGVVVAYRATARRDEDVYTAMISSTYIHEEGDWKLVVHQHTPV